MSEATAKLGLPMLAAGQAQKEGTHNEALALADLAIAAAVEGVGAEDPPANPAPGQAWILGANPRSAWAGRAFALAGWTDGGWRFVEAFEGLGAWVVPDALPVRFVGGTWTAGELRGRRVLVDGVPVVGARRPAIPDPAGGGAVDAEARAALAQVLAALRAHGLIAG